MANVHAILRLTGTAFALCLLTGCATKPGMAKRLSEWHAPVDSPERFIGVYSNEPIHEVPEGWPDHSLFHLLTNQRPEKQRVGIGMNVRVSKMPSGDVLAELLAEDGRVVEKKLTTLEFIEGYLISDRRNYYTIRVLFNSHVTDQMAFTLKENGDLVSLRNSNGTIYLVIMPIFGGGGGPPVSFRFPRQE